MKQTQSFLVKPQGCIRNGSFVYTADEDTGQIEYAGRATGKLGFFSKTIDIPTNNFTIDPKYLLSSALQNPGDQIVIGNVTFTAIAVQPGVTTVSLDIPDGGYISNASATLDTTDTYFRVKQILGHVRYSFFSVDIQADAVNPGLFGGNSDFPWYLPIVIPLLVIWTNIKSRFSR